MDVVLPESMAQGKVKTAISARFHHKCQINKEAYVLTKAWAFVILRTVGGCDNLEKKNEFYQGG